MNEQERQKLSALMDAEIPRSEISRDLGKLLKDTESLGSWRRYHLIGDAMRQELGPVVEINLAGRVSARLVDEPVVFAPAALKRSAGRWYRPAAGAAVAASVAMFAIALAPRVIDLETEGQPINPVAQTRPPVETVYVADDGTRWELLYQPKVESRLNSYLVNYHESAPAGNLKGIMPYAKFVSYDDKR
jgi:sigma-E factor negative regulatory protein RseA